MKKILTFISEYWPYVLLVVTLAVLTQIHKWL